MHAALVFGVLGRMMMYYALIMMAILAVALYYRENTLGSHGLTILVTGAAGWVMKASGSMKGRLGAREGFGIVAGGWLLASLFGALPLWLTNSVPTYIDAFFETVSGLTTTGASVMSNLSAVPNSILLWRSITHWLGGMGIIVLFIAVLPNIGAGAAHLFQAEVPGPTAERVAPRIRDTAMALWKIYGILTLLEIVLLMLAGMPLFDAVNHAFATLATGGFSTRDASIRYYDSLAVEIIVIVFMTLAGGSFALYYQSWSKGAGKVWGDTEFRCYILIILFAAAIITGSLCLENGDDVGPALRAALFQVVSVITTTGFITADFDQWPPLAKLILFLLMFIGGSAGSTAGGIKVARIILLCKQGWAELKRAIHPRVVISINVDGKNVEPSVLTTVAQFFFVYMLIYAAAVLMMAATGLEPFDALSAVAATLGNVGPGFGVVGPATTYAAITPFGKMVLSVCMLLGRLELFTLLVLIRPEFWRSQRNW